MKLEIFPKHTILSRYLLQAHAGPFVFSVSTLMFLFLLQFVMKFIDQLVGKGLSAWLIIELITLNLAWMLVLAIPMSVLVATLMAFGDLSSRNEITAMKASGVSIYRMIATVFVTATLLAILFVFFNNDVLPEANHRAKSLAIDIRRKKPTLTLVGGLFSQDVAGYSIRVEKAHEKTNELEGVILYDYTNPNTNISITAKRGSISFSPDFRKLVLNLQDGEIHELDIQKMGSYRRVRFKTHRIAMDVEGLNFERSAEGTFSRGDREMSASEMNLIVDSLLLARDTIALNVRKIVDNEIENVLTGKPKPFAESGAAMYYNAVTLNALNRARVMSATVNNELVRVDYLDKQIDQYRVEIHKKYAIPAACLVFVLVGIPLGVMSRRGGFGVAASLSFGFFILYWAFLIGGEKFADRNLISPFWGMWAANILFGAVGLYLSVRIGKEAVVIDWSALRRLIPRRWRTEISEEKIEKEHTR